MILEYDNEFDCLFDKYSGNIICPICIKEMTYDTESWSWYCMKGCKGYIYNEKEMLEKRKRTEVI